MSTRIPSITTAEQLLAAPYDLGPCELVRGELVMIVWDIDPGKRTVTVHRVGSEPQTLDENGLLTEPTLLPGFEMPVRELFAW